MSNSTSNSQRENSAFYKTKEKVRDITEGDWVGLGALIAILVVAALVVAIFAYYLITDDFTVANNGKYSDIGWASSGGGLLMLFFVVLFTTFAGGAFGLSMKSKTNSLISGIGVTLLLSVVFYWAFDAAHAERAFQILMWVIIAVVGGIAVSAWGWKSSKELSDQFVDVAERSNYSMYMLIGAVISGIVLFVGFWSIYDKASNLA